jgi:hypothetical protein
MGFRVEFEGPIIPVFIMVLMLSSMDFNVEPFDQAPSKICAVTSFDR